MFDKNGSVTYTIDKKTAFNLKGDGTMTNKKAGLPVAAIVTAALLLAILTVVSKMLSAGGESGGENDTVWEPHSAAIGEASAYEVGEFPGVTLTMEPAEYSTEDTEVSFVLENSNDITYDYDVVQVEILVDGVWHSVTDRPAPENTVIGDDLLGKLILPGETLKPSQSLWRYGDAFPEGTYRLVVGVAESEEFRGFDTYVAAEYTVIK